MPLFWHKQEYLKGIFFWRISPKLQVLVHFDSRKDEWKLQAFMRNGLWDIHFETLPVCKKETMF